MGKGTVARYGKPHGVRFLKGVEKDLIRFCEDNQVNESDIIQYAVRCFLRKKECIGRKQFFEHR